MTPALSAPDRGRNGRAAAALALGALLLSACFEVDSRHGVEPRQDRLFVASARISAETGGIVAATVPNTPHALVSLEVPPAALTEDTEIALFVRLGDPRLPQVVQVVEVEPRGLELAMPATIVVDYGPYYEEVFGSLFPEGGLELFSFVDDPRDDCRHHQVMFQDVERNLIRAEIAQFGSFFAMHPDVRRLGLRRARLVDPAVSIRTAAIAGRLEAIPGGSFETSVGRGSLESFWTSSSEQNLLIVHGLGEDAIGVSTQGSVAPASPDAGFNRDFANVVVFEYASARSLMESGGVLYNALRDGAGTSFGTCVLAHGTGGLVVRYALELAQHDPARLGARPDDPPLDAWVDRAVFVATPNLGSGLVAARFADLLRATELDDTEFVAGLLELMPSAGGLLERLGHGLPPLRTRYYAIAGDWAGREDDGLVEVSSALTLPDSSPAEAYQVFSGPLYNHLALTALADFSGVVAQSRVWFGKNRTNQRPVIGSVDTAEISVIPTVRVSFTLSDADRDDCVVQVDYSLDGVFWRTARDAAAHPVELTLPSLEAPGRDYEIAFSTVMSGIPVYAPIPLRVRIRASDTLGEGTSGETGVFTVSPFDLTPSEDAR